MNVSFRDPAGKLFFHQEEVYRIVNHFGWTDFQCSLDSKVLTNFLEAKNLVKVEQLDSAEIEALKIVAKDKFGILPDKVSTIVKHEKVPFLSYPYEWTAEMLHSAALLTLNLAEKLLHEGIGLKDATPFNILFRGAKPVFVDWLSFENRDPNDPIWLSKSQFIRTFCLPLLVNKYLGFHLSWVFRVNRDGLEPENVYQMLSFRKKLSPAFFSVVTLPKWLGSASQNNSSIYQKHTVEDPEKAQFILSRQFKSLRRLLQKIEPAPDQNSNWTEYIGKKQHFTDAYLSQKDRFVKEALQEFKPQNVLDVGCNTGYFSRIAALNGASVVSIDQDPVVVGKTWQMANRENLDILPLVVDISRPTPAIGWRNAESVSFLSRVKGKMDGVMMLAVLHHLLVTERIPLSQILELMTEITKDILIIEFVPPDDPMFKQIARGRDHLFEHLNTDVFRKVCQKHFKILRSEKLADSNRQLFLLQK